VSSVRGPPSALISALIRRRPEYCLATGRIYSYTTAPRGLSSFEAGTRPMGVGTRSPSTIGGSYDDWRSDISRDRWFDRCSRLHRAQIAMILIMITRMRTSARVPRVATARLAAKAPPGPKRAVTFARGSRRVSGRLAASSIRQDGAETAAGTWDSNFQILITGHPTARFRKPYSAGPTLW
jgi:hypothetical protein